MNKLQIFNNPDGAPTLDSREVAEMVDKQHNELLKDIRRYCEHLNAGGFPLVDFFIEHAYKDGKGESRPCYLVTRKGCDMVANKLTGEKGVIFSARYINRFHEMEQTQGIPKSLPEALRLAADLAERGERLMLEVAQKDQLIGELKPKADYVDWVLQNPGLVTITQIAKDYGMSGNKMNALLHDLGVQYKQSGQWLLYRQYHDKGFTHSETIDITRSDGRPDIEMHTKWTQKGRLFIYELLKADGILPIIEQARSA